MAKRRRRSSKLKSLPKAAQVVAFTDAEEAFFREGDTAESFDHLEEAVEEKPSLWRRLFSRAA
jgi:hypothetical protein